MAQNVALELLNIEREKLILERDRIYEQFNTDIRNIENAIDKLDGKKYWDYGSNVVYDDNNPDYIKGSIEN